jgi:acyl carrier protein
MAPDRTSGGRMHPARDAPVFAACFDPRFRLRTVRTLATVGNPLSNRNVRIPFSMTKEEITSELRELLRKQKQLKVDVDAVGVDTRFDQIGFDSLSILDFMYEVENRFGTFPEMAELVKMQQVDDLVEFLAAHAPA